MVRAGAYRGWLAARVPRASGCEITLLQTRSPQQTGKMRTRLPGVLRARIRAEPSRVPPARCGAFRVFKDTLSDTRFPGSGVG